MGDDSLNRVGPEWNGYLGRLSLQGEVRFGENVQGLDTRLGGGSRNWEEIQLRRGWRGKNTTMRFFLSALKKQRKQAGCVSQLASPHTLLIYRKMRTSSFSVI